MTIDNDDSEIQQVDAALRKWKQGDFVLGNYPFIYQQKGRGSIPNESLPSSSWWISWVVFLKKNITRWVTATANNYRNHSEDQNDAELLGLDRSQLIAEETKGLVIVTQTCDIVRTCKFRRFVEVVPLIKVLDKMLEEIQQGKRPQYAFIPGASSECLVADLDRVMTIEKAVVADWPRLSGCENDQHFRQLGQALARKRIRFAFPDDFTKFANKLQKRLKEKHSKQSQEGNALRALREIRVSASPSWNHNEVQLMFWFIREEEEIEFQGVAWYECLEKWLKLVPESGRFQAVEGQVITLEDMTAKDYLGSDRLDLDHLSG